MRNLLLVATLLAVVVLTVAGCGQKPAATETPQVNAPAPPADGAAAGDISGELTVFVPCGMIIPVRGVIDRFEELHPQLKVHGVYDNAGILVERMANKGEQADVFISPGNVELGLVEKAGLVDASQAKTIGSFELVIIQNKNNTLKVASPEDLRKCARIASPDPAKNSVGASGKEALTKLGLWDELQPKFVLTKQAIQSHTMVASGKVDAGIAYRNCPLETNPEKLSTSKVQIACEFPTATYTLQPCLIATMKDVKNPAAAKAFIEFVTSEEGLKILDEKGMTGCLELGECAVGLDPNAKVRVQAFYPGNEGHAHIKKMIEALPGKFGDDVSSEFVDFTSDEGFDKWQAAGLSCGAILINDQQTWTYEKDGKPVEVTFKMAMGGEWTEEDLNAVIKKLLAE